jgi:hypothetical protein
MKRRWQPVVPAIAVMVAIIAGALIRNHRDGLAARQNDLKTRVASYKALDVLGEGDRVRNLYFVDVTPRFRQMTPKDQRKVVADLWDWAFSDEDSDPKGVVTLRENGHNAESFGKVDGVLVNR